MNNKSLRRAIVYGMNVSTVAKRYTSGLIFHIPTLTPERFGKYHDEDVKGYGYSVKKGNEILDKAGYEGKGRYHVQLNGESLATRLTAMTSSSTREPTIRDYIQQWKRLSLNAKLAGGRLMEMNSFHNKVRNDSKDTDMPMGVWSLSSESSPNDLYNVEAPYSFTRFVTAKSIKLLQEMDSEKSFNINRHVKKFHEWQEYMNDGAYIAPISNGYNVNAVNSRITGHPLKPPTTNSLWYNVGIAK